MKPLVPICVLFLCGLGARAAAGELNADTFHLSGSALDDAGTLQLVHPHIGLPSSFYGGLGVVYSHDPLVWQLSDGSKQTVVDSQLSTRLAMGYNLLGRLRFDVEVPVYPSVVVEGEGRFAMGDTRLGVVVPLVSYEDDGVGLAIAPFVALPTASEGAWLSTGGVTGGATASVGGEKERLHWAINVGADLGASSEAYATTVGSAALVSASAAIDLAEPLLIGAELGTRLDLTGGGGWNEDPVEAHLFSTWSGERGLVATVGGGSGIVPGAGAPDVRALLVVGYRHPGAPKVRDQDQDGLSDELDRCPTDPEDADRYEDEDGCPDLDNDQDGVVDLKDKCPLEAEDRDEWKDKDGCPDPDNDEDGVLDAADACPVEAGLAALGGCPDSDGDSLADRKDECPAEAGPVAARGCPDRDGDRVPDKRDQCPDEAVDPRSDPDRSDGCPARVVVTTGSIAILDKVYFETNKAKIKAESDTLLKEIAQVLQKNPYIKLVEVAGHTDDQGVDKTNLQLSQARAEAVVNWLVSKGGIEASRLTAKGYGETKPIDTNGTAAGRANNRRVELNILEQ